MKALLREVTFSADTLLRSVMMSSVIPSLKYSCSWSPLMLAKGRTQMATRGALAAAAEGAAPADLPDCARCRLITAESERSRSWNGALEGFSAHLSRSVV